MVLVEIHQINRFNPIFKEIDDLCFKSKNLYNKCIYKIKQFKEEHNGFRKEGEKYAIYNNITLYHLNKDEPEYRNGMPTRPLKGIYIQIHRSYQSFWKALIDYRRNPDKYQAEPKEPGYKPKDGRNILTYPKEALRFKKDGTIQLSMSNIFIETKQEKKDILEVRLVPGINHYKVEVVYEKDINVNPDLDENRYYGIDLGVNNLATLSSNELGIRPIIINGRPVKSINQYYNKEKARLQEELEEGKKTSKQIQSLTRKRNNKMKDYFHKASKFIINLCIKNNVKTIVIGKNDEWKLDIKSTKKNNQSFNFIPHNQLISMLRYKGQLVGVNVVEHEESYTSKCSFLDDEEICKQVNYSGKRKKRGLFVSGLGKSINADLNASLNILKKVIGKGLFNLNSIEDYAVNPIRLNDFGCLCV